MSFEELCIVFTYECTFCLSTGGNSYCGRFSISLSTSIHSKGLELDVSVFEATLLIVTGVLWVFVIHKFNLSSSHDFNCFTKPVFLVCQVNCFFWKWRLHIFLLMISRINKILPVCFHKSQRASHPRSPDFRMELWGNFRGSSPWQFPHNFPAEIQE